MKAALLAAAAISTAGLAQVPTIKSVPPAIIGPIDLPLQRQFAAPLPCSLSPGVIGEKGSGAIIGEEGSDAIVGEKGSGAVIGEEGSVASASKRFAGSWKPGGTMIFRHVILAPSGQVKVALRGCSSSPSGQTLRLTAEGASLQQSLLARSAGAAISATMTMPRSAPGKLSRVPILITIDSPAGTPAAAGIYEVTITR